MQKIKSKVLEVLNEQTFPDLKFLFSEEVLDISLELLDELLEIDKKDFVDLLKIKNKYLSFDSFEKESLLDYFWSLLNHLQNVNNTDKIRQIIETFRPKLQDFGNFVAYNKDYYNQNLYIYKNINLDKEQKRIIKLRLKAFKNRGIDLDQNKQEDLKQINKDLAKVQNNFSNNIVDSEAEFSYEINNFEVIKDLPKEVLEKTKQNNKYIFDADPTSCQAIMQYCSDTKIRTDFAIANYSFASKGKFDNRENILEILKLRDKQAKLLGYNNYAELSINVKMADSPSQIFELIEGISQKATKKSKQELDVLKKYFNLENISIFDLAYYTRKYKQDNYNVDDKKIKKYFELEYTVNYLHNFVKDFYGLELRQVKLDSYNDNIRIYEVYKDKTLISYYFMDLFYTKNKRAGAWADNLRSKEYVGIKKLPIVVNVCNFAQNKTGKNTLSLRDTETLFHEFGHAIHEMLSESKYSELSGFEVEWDFVELPSQLLENWVSDRESLQKLARHVETKETMSEELLNKLDSLKTYNSGIFVARQNEFALLDISLYSSKIPQNIDELDELTLKIVNKYSIFTRKDDYKMYCSFSHIFGGGYAAGYYSYMWAEIIEADIFSKIKKDGMFDPKVGEKLIETILGQGTRKKAKEMFFDFMGREVNNKAFMNRKGL